MKVIEKIRERLGGAEALLLISPVNRRYVSGFASSDGMALITQNSAHLIVDSRYILAARESVQLNENGLTVHLTGAINGTFTEIVKRLLHVEQITRVGFEEDYISFAQHKNLLGKLECELIPCGYILTELRSVKSEEELRRLRAAQALTDEVFTEMLSVICPGVTEKRIAAEITYRFLLKGAQNVSFDPIVASGTNSAKPHAVPSDKEIQRGDFVTLDFGCILDGYCSDMTRTVAVGAVTEEQKLIYQTVLRAQSAGVAAARAGVTGKSVHEAAAAVIADAGYGEFFGHGFGHGLGLEIHERPNAAPSWDKPLPEGAVISAEPGIYLPDKFGVRIEDVIIVRSGNAEDITNSAKDLIVL
ncbi:MAG: Xaa-Pro peptidase family protein [Oscillospiraceae bacterium]|nr:Xaa-Pro peptidase family protein [Oscillospiraceae bacterium]